MNLTLAMKKATFLAGLSLFLVTPALADDIMTTDQAAGTSLTVQSVTISQDGWLVIHAIKDGKPVVPASIGHTAVKAGTTENVVVELDEAVASGAKVLTMLHVDEGEAGAYEFPGPDHPVMQDGKPVVKPLSIQ